MKILATGMEWAEHRPGGLNYYFADYLKAMNQYGHTVEGLISSERKVMEAPSYIRDVVSGSAKLGTYQRMKFFHASIRDRTSVITPDIINPHFGLYASLTTRRFIPGHVPIVTHFHGPWAQESLVEDGGNQITKLLRYQIKKRIEQTTYRRSDAFIVLSDYFRALLSREFGIAKDSIHRIPGAADIERFRPSENRGALREELGILEDQKVLFCARRLVRRMGIDQLIRAMAEVSREAPSTLLFIAGQGALKEEYEQLIEELRLQSTVRLLGRVSDEDLVRWYQAADLSVVPTRTLEGFGLVTTESLACGTPVLGTPYGGTKEILEPFSNQLLFREGSPDAIAEKIISILKGDCSIPSREECRQHVLQHYTWTKVARSVTRVFDQAIQQRKELGKYESSLL
ncbi:glycosyltransferase family 4 protein [Cohnella luojiensis]|uniref:Glycosyltransferase family 1 protein n=1 Tax=Cohnella luojiensis TaxID=652876 RepID=A0A4Y8LZ88_9BACL|nr:glycosyltransferase family 4 protein [Cohnella luojiensis]TFE27276.1 glycosyltransferase family 1 protein [Cohnella luojiensis]